MLNANNQLSFVPARSNDGRVDIEASVLAARKVAEEFAAQDDILTIQIGEAAIKVWNEPKYSNLLHISTTALARMALTVLDMVPDDKACKDAALRVRAVLSGQPDKFLVLKNGPNKGVHHLARLSAGEIALLITKKK